MNYYFKIKDEKYTIKGCTILQYYLVQPNLVEESINDKVQVLAILSDCPDSILRCMDPAQFNLLWNHIATNVLTIDFDAEPIKELTIEGQVFTMVDPLMMTIGEWADLDVLHHKKESLHETLAFIYRPANEIGYQPKLCTERAHMFKTLDVKTVMSTINFFLSFSKKLVMDTLHSIIKKQTLPKEQRKLVQISLELLQNVELCGTSSFYSSLEMILSDLKKQANSITEQLLTSQPTITKNKWNLIKRLRNKEINN